MKAVFFALGSRGDIEPLFSLGEALCKMNWEIVYVFPKQFEKMVQIEKAKFYGFSKEFIEVLLASEKSKEVTSRKGSVISRVKTLFHLASKSIKINREATIYQKEIIESENPDVVFFNQKCVYPIVWGIMNPSRAIFVHPFPCFLHSVNSHSIIGFSGGGNYGKFLNQLSYKVQRIVLSLATYFMTKNILKKEGGVKTNPLEIKRHLLNRILSIYTISPSLFKKPSTWGSNAIIIGFAERDKSKYWKPDDTLLEFLKSNKHKKVIFITFGSISNTNPELKTRAILDVLKKHETPAIINTSWGGLVKVTDSPKHVLFVKNIPYDWIFPRVYGVVHHGGAGTTHSAIKYGCSSLIIPHFIDQFFWSKIIVKEKLGPKGVSIKQLNSDNFEKPFLDFIENEDYKTTSEKLSIEIQKEFEVIRLIDKLKNKSFNEC